jgi:transposase
VRLISPQLARPYVKNNKTDAADAEAIYEAVNRPHMRFVPIKTQAQQTMLSLHRALAELVKSRTALVNQIRGLLSEFGIVLPQGIRLLRQRAIESLSNREFEHCEQFRTLIQMLVEHLRELGNKVAELEGRIRAMHRTDAPGQLLETIPGVGPLTASALAASIGDPRAFRDGRELAAWLGLVPRQHSSGGKPLAGHQQARRYSTKNTSDSRCSRCYSHGSHQARNGRFVGHETMPRSAQKHRCRGARSKKCTNGVGSAGSQTDLSS